MFVIYTCLLFVEKKPVVVSFSPAYCHLQLCLRDIKTCQLDVLVCHSLQARGVNCEFGYKITLP